MLISVLDNFVVYVFSFGVRGSSPQGTSMFPPQSHFRIDVCFERVVPCREQFLRCSISEQLYKFLTVLFCARSQARQTPIRARRPKTSMRAAPALRDISRHSKRSSHCGCWCEACCTCIPHKMSPSCWPA